MSSEIDLLSFVRSRLTGLPSAATSVSVNSSISNSCDPIPESWEDIVSDLGRSVSPSTAEPPSVSSMPLATSTGVVFFTSCCCCLLLPLLFLLGLSGAHCFRLSQQRVQWVINGWFGVLQLKHFTFSFPDFIETSPLSSFSSSLSAQYTLSTTLVTGFVARKSSSADESLFSADEKS